MLQKHFLAFLTVFSFVAAGNGSMAQNLNVVTSNGTVSHSLSTLESIVFKNGIFVVKDADCGDHYYSDFFSTQLNFGESVSGIADFSETRFVIFPNPANDLLTVQLAQEETLEGNIVSLSGTIVQTFVTTGQTTALDVGNLVSGVYFLAVGNQTLKFIKQ